MLKRATQEARQAPSRGPKSDLEKQLFPSSSPVGPQRSMNIADSFKKAPSFSGSSLTTSRATISNPPLKTRPTMSSQASNRLASIVNKDAFHDTTDSFETVSMNTKATNKNAVASVLLFEDDFSDDDQLDLDYKAPTALPSMPPPALKATSTQEQNLPPNSSIVSWSSSPPFHMAPSASRASIPTSRPKKRESPDEDRAEPVRATKRRELPWATQSKAEPIDVDALYPDTPAPAHKGKKENLWDATASGLKAQKRQLKDQSKATPNPSHLTMDEIKQIVHPTPAGKSSAGGTTAIVLSNEQRHVKDLVVDKGKSVFFTGPAGTGKSVLMRAIIEDMKKKYARDPERVAVTASTGLAACNIGGMTLHSFAGIGLGKEEVGVLVKKIRRNPKAKNRWLKTKVLIIDEVSMVDGDLFDKLSQIGRTIRNNGRPWGGIQLVITGDFFQLPPVPDKFDAGKARDVKFSFEAATWTTTIDHTIGLTEVFRQRDPVFANMLNEMRLGRISDETVRSFKALQRPLHFDDGLDVTELFPTRNEVDMSNQRRLAALPEKLYKFPAMDTGPQDSRERLLANMMAPPVLELKKGAQVMLIKNMDDTLVNGSLGKVIGFMSENSFEQSGEGLLNVESDVFKKRLNIFANQLDKSAEAKGDGYEYPLVKFRAVNGTERNLLCVPEDWKVELPTGEVQASRKQVPLILAWALSIHKAQGQTLERVKVDLGKVFEKGQAYVALSRATTQQGLQVLRFQKEKVMAHPRVVDFYNQLYDVESIISKKTQTKLSNFPCTPAGRLESRGRSAVDNEAEQAMSMYG